MLMFFIAQTRAAQRGEKILFHPGKSFSGNRIARDQNQFHRLREFMLMPPETFAEQPPGAAAVRRVADFFAGDDAEPGRGAVGQLVPVGDEAAEREPFALLPDAREIAALREPRRAAQAQAFRRRGFTKSNRRQAFAAHAAAVGQRGLAALGGIAVQKPVLAFAADFRRLILAFHKFKSKSSPAQKPERARIAVNGLVSRQASRFTSHSTRAGCRIFRCVCAAWRG